MALKKVKGTLERVLDKNLQDLVRGIRNHKENEGKYIAECIDEIKQELRQENQAVKANAVNKLIYLQMLGYDISWAAFHIIEVMSSTKYTIKRIGYIAASQSFHENTDVLMLTTNMIRKDLSSQNMYDAGIALSGLSCFVTPDLARDLANDIMTLMTSTRPYLRKKAVLIMYKVFLQFPEALRPAFPRLKEKLEDPDQGVQSAAVNVICELARKNPQNYLSLAPLFFKLMTSSTNNWVLIKIIKLFSALTPLEPRLGKKLIEPLTNLIHSTSAMSLLYECINTVIAGIPNHTASIQLCVQKLRILIEDSDQNLKYLGLLAMSKILATHPKSVQSHKDLILQCLDDKDESIRLRALDLIYGMVSKKNLMEIVKKLMVHMDKAEGTHYRDELLAKIVEISSQSNYQYITNFEWYVSVLVELTRMEGTRHGRMIASQMLDVAIRVQAIRPFAVAQMALLLENSYILANNSQRNGICEVLYAAAWICGEFSQHLKNPREALEAMLKPKITTLPGHIQSVFVQNILKLFGSILKTSEENEDQENMKELCQLLTSKLPIFVQSADLEVQERACCMLQLVKYVQKLIEKGAKVGDEVCGLFAGDLNPVAPKAQRKVPVPEGLDLDKWINEPLSESSSDEEPTTSIFAINHEDSKAFYKEEKRNVPEPTEEELEKRREQRKIEQMHNPHYLRMDKKSKKSSKVEEAEESPVMQIDLSIPLHVPGLASSDKYLKLASQDREKSRKKTKHGKHKKKKKGQPEEESDEDVPTQHAVSTLVDMPEGANTSDKEDERNSSDPFKRLDMDLDQPLRDDEILPVRSHRIVMDSIEPGDEEVKPKKKHKKVKDKDKEEKKKHRKEGKEKKSKKKQKADEASGSASNLLMTGESSPEHVPVANGLPQSPEQEKADQEKENDLDFWMNNNSTATSKSTENVIKTPEVSVEYANVSSEEESQKEKKTKKKKEKKPKKEKKSKKDKKLLRADYEEAEGITTPSKEQVPPSQAETPVAVQLPPMSSYVTLGENDSIKMTYDIRASHQRGDQIIVSVVFSNLTEHTIKDLEFNVMETMNLKLIRSMGSTHHDPIKVPFILLPNSQNEGQFAFTVHEIKVAQKLKGTLTYILKMDEGSTHEKVDFKLVFPCSSFLVATPCKGSAFTTLLESGDLTEKSSIQFTPQDSEFQIILAKVCFYHHFRVVEQVEKNASVYSKSIQGHPVCLLIKKINGDIKIDGKSTEGNLLSNVLQEIKTTLV
ncbi:AP-3 complex subunit delta-1-like isoform X2 [Saccostrea echinata]|uniref:AP-3 complex subunit delta-1-like isoform X2 n=1 Tax=Saccostrea echinata TaxID=191078 RepID=UPI002A81AEFB|nr:AP-3 complex subunit delta-1-like isoform X2 [Saccostrea echinata]